ncbi:ADP-ribosyl-(dinitrogen reductase) hydrolase [Cysteiniphilum halobium]|uniref:ADP-ribosyl-(dinitrogen reductase) hydrolase n=1 Tax=Cysteiniphilum halobium TaxID=2219059 RepID=UPI003F83D2F3
MLIITPKIKDKLWHKHRVTVTEVTQCFINRDGCTLIDDRENNRTVPPTQWFIAKTDNNRNLKVVFIEFDEDVVIKTTYEPNAKELEIYTCMNTKN